MKRRCGWQSRRTKANTFYPFGAVIVGAADRTVLAQDVNNTTNPVLHGEIVAINDYVAHHGNKGWADRILYTTGEPCPMCMSAISELTAAGSSMAARSRRWRMTALQPLASGDLFTDSTSP
jgi:tRNA(Arg) A34 adenosine deaminase TadA